MTDTNLEQELAAVLAQLDDSTNQTMRIKRARWARLVRHQFAEIERLQAELAGLRGQLAQRKFAGWFREVQSCMSYRLWEQGGHEQRPGDVALYE